MGATHCLQPVPGTYCFKSHFSSPGLSRPIAKFGELVFCDPFFTIYLPEHRSVDIHESFIADVGQQQ